MDLIEDSEVTVEGQFELFCTYCPLYKQHSRTSRLDPDGPQQPSGTIRLPQSDYWMRQANILDDRKLTMTDTGLAYFFFEKVFMNFDEWCRYLEKLCKGKELDLEEMKTALTNCGIPGQTPITLPEYRNYYNVFKAKDKGLVNKEVSRRSIPQT